MSEGGGGTVVKALILVVFLGGTCGVLGLAALTLVGGKSSGTPTSQPPAPVVAPPAGAVVPPPAPPPTSMAGPAVARIRDRGKLVVAMDTGEPAWSGTPPMYFLGESGEPDGFDVALAHRIAEELGVADVQVVHAKYSELPARLTGDPAAVDLLISGYSPDDTPGIAWSRPYLEYGLCLVVPSGSPVKTTADLFGKPVGIFDDDAAAAEVKSLVKGYTELVRLEDGYWDQLVEGRFAGFLYDYPYAAAELNLWYKQNPSRKGSLRVAQYNLTDSTYAVGVRAGEADLSAAVDRSIAAWRDSEAYAAAVRHHLSGGIAVDAPVEGKKTHVVAAGETLSIIAKQELGATERWQDLWAANRDRFPNPHLIEVGDRVVIP